MPSHFVQDKWTGVGVDQLGYYVAPKVVAAEPVSISETFSPAHTPGLQHCLVVIPDPISAVVGEGFGQHQLKLGHQLGRDGDRPLVFRVALESSNPAVLLPQLEMDQLVVGVNVTPPETPMALLTTAGVGLDPELNVVALICLRSGC